MVSERYVECGYGAFETSRLAHETGLETSYCDETRIEAIAVAACSLDKRRVTVEIIRQAHVVKDSQCIRN